MENNDTRKISRTSARQAIRDAATAGDSEALSVALEQMAAAIAGEYAQEVQELRASADAAADTQVLAARGVRQLTSDEQAYYTAVLGAMRSSDPKQALSNIDLTFPITVVNSVFDELRSEFPLLGLINFHAVTGNTRLLMDTSEYQQAVWGELCDDIVKEIAGGFQVVDSGLYKLSALMFVCKPGLELGPEWLDSYVREVLYESLANALEFGIVDGTGKDMPIGMTRQVGTGVTVTDGVYPRKSAVTVNDLSPATVGNLLALMSRGASGRLRRVRDLVLLVNPEDYYTKVMPATTLQAPDGTYRNDVMPYPMTIIPTEALSTRGEAVLGSASRYFATAGISRNGRIEYSDEYRFGEDKRVYLIKTYANGRPMDNTSFLLLDISNLKPARWKVEDVAAADADIPSDDATLAALSLGTAALSPAFDAETTEYTATATGTSDVVIALPADAGAHVAITVAKGSAEPVDVANGSAITWATGTNTVTVNLTAEDGTTTESYTVTVTKS